MNCPYASNTFCSSLPECIRLQMCSQCILRSRPKDFRFNLEEMRSSFVIHCDGLMVTCESKPKDQDKLIVNGISSGGNPISLGTIEQPSEMQTRECVCITDSHFAFVDMQLIDHLFNTEVKFVQTVFYTVVDHCSVEKNRFLTNTLGGAYTAVRYLINYCNRHHIPQLTHEEIAFICNLRRPTVTKMIHQILLNEPYLFRS